MSFWSDLSKTVNAPNWYDNPNPVVLGYGEDGEGNRTPYYGDIFRYLRGSSDPETGAVTPDNQAAMDSFKNLPVLPNLTNIDNTKRTGMLNGRQVQWGMPGENAEEFSPTGDGRQARAMTTQGDTRFAQIAGRTEDGKLVFSSPIQSQPPPRATSGSFGDFLKDIAPSALAAFAGPQIAGALGSAGLSSGAAAAGSGAIVGGGSAALRGGDIGRGALLGGAGAAIGNQLFGASGGNALAGRDLSAFDYPTLAGAEAQAYGAPALGMSAAEQIATGPRFANNIVGVPTEATSFNTALDYANAGYDIPSDFPEYANAGYDVPNEAYRQPFDLEYGDGMGGPASSAMRAAGAVSPATPGLIAQLANYTGLSTGAIERLGGAAISSLAGLYGANVVGNAADRAANRLAESNQTATQLQKKIYEDQVARQQPFYQAGVNALPDYIAGIRGTEEDRKAGRAGSLVRPFSMDDYQADPGYGFRMSEGMKALDRSAASRGRLLSGETIKDAQRFGQGLATQEYQNAYNRYGSDQATRRNALAGLTGFAPTAAQQLNASGVNYAANVNDLGASTARNYGNADLTGAAARQSAYAGAGGAFANALSPNPYTAFLNRQMGVIG